MRENLVMEKYMALENIKIKMAVDMKATGKMNYK